MYRIRLLFAAVAAAALSVGGFVTAPAGATDNHAPGSWAVWLEVPPMADQTVTPVIKQTLYSRLGDPTKMDQQVMVSNAGTRLDHKCSAVTLKVKSPTGNWVAMSPSMGGITSCTVDQLKVTVNNLPKNWQFRVVAPFVFEPIIGRPVVMEYYNVYSYENDFLDESQLDIPNTEFGEWFLYVANRP